jgi:enoyl-CoA hydratase/carnithine racemase
MMSGDGFNPLDLDLARGLADCLAALETEPECRAVVLSSRDRHFCAGATSKFTTVASQWSTRDLYAQVPRIAAFGKPLVVAMNGAAVGGGAGLALLGDWRQMSSKGRIQVNFAVLGYTPGFALTRTLPALVGHHRAAELLMSGRPVLAPEALRIGLCDGVSEPDELIADALGRADMFAAAGPLAVRAIKAGARAPLLDGLADVLAAELRQQDELRGTHDYAEGMAAVMERRTPSFEGR